MATGDFVAYYRVSTARQGQSGHGLEAQRRAVTDYLNGGNWRLVGEFTEVESGKQCNRPELAKALSLARVMGARLVVAKLDRLARNAAFLFNLRDAGVAFVAADMPDANEMTVGIMAVIAEGEAKAISKRTKDALRAAKARGAVLGGWRGKSIPTDATRHSATASRRNKAVSRAMDLAGVITSVRDHLMATADRGQAPVTAQQIARELTNRGIPTPSGTGTTWQAVQVNRVLARAGVFDAGA